MLVNEENILVGPCGVFCGGCLAHLAGEDSRAMEQLVAMGMPRESLPCPGCRTIGGLCPVIPGGCVTYRCADNHNVEFCFQCPDFPCAKLNPAADKAAVLPHNLKVFNLCFIKEKGLQAWKDRAREIRDKYFDGRMELGKGPRVE